MFIKFTCLSRLCSNLFVETPGTNGGGVFTRVFFETVKRWGLIVLCGVVTWKIAVINDEPSMGRTVYFPIHGWFICMVN